MRREAPLTVLDVHLIRNPRTCEAGTWGGFGTLAFPDGSEAVLGSPIACRPP